ncbi:glutamate-5-semialdehyde dehydrogenase [Porphyromonas loveana]|uniref:glutamate-5-semialdehyde dehydrogenase n=1 Tax=Porphyromonas loveana TaxID=1884669 RepID=UPI0035A1172A
MLYETIFKKVKKASKELSLLSEDEKNKVLCAVADEISKQKGALLTANRKDLDRMDTANPMYDRLQLTAERLESIAADMRHVATLPSPLGRILKETRLENGLLLRKVSVPFGVIGMVYEARPNVTFDVFSLCFKSGNACLLKGGRDADESNRAGVALIHDVLERFGINSMVVGLLPATHEATAALLNGVGYIDLCIPRGSKRLIDFVRETAKVPVIETGAGVVHCYFDEKGSLLIAPAIIDNAKTRRCSVCNALDCLLVHRARLSDLPALVAPLAAKGVVLHADKSALVALEGHYPPRLLVPVAGDEEYHTEWLSLQMGIRTVDSLNEALEHIATFGSGHSETIITEDTQTAEKFQAMVDAACVYVNAATSFTDGGQFGLGAEIGISTQKLGGRGPMALEEITTYKWLINGHGQIRK